MNNRQAGGRRRGRGGQRSQGGNPNQQGNGNRIDNRARGNAAQLLEKYKNLARDAQMQGDRVNTEYYLQFADHYFRVLSESRSRFEDQNQQRRGRDDQMDDDGFEGEEGFEGDLIDGGDLADAPRMNGHGNANGNGYHREGRENRNERGDNRERGNRRDSAPRENVENEEAPAAVAAEDQGAPRRRGRRPRAEAVEDAGTDTVIEADRLPPALSVSDSAGDDDGEAKPRRRTRRPRATEEEVVGQA